jgi:hypothetical protein
MLFPHPGRVVRHERLARFNRLPVRSQTRQGPPSYAGTWTVSSVDGAATPAVLTQVRGPDPASLTKRELQTAILRLADDGTYVLTVQERKSILDTQGHVMEVTPVTRTETGNYASEPSEVILAPVGGQVGTRYALARQGDELVDTHIELGHLVNLKKIP